MRETPDTDSEDLAVTPPKTWAAGPAVAHAMQYALSQTSPDLAAEAGVTLVGFLRGDSMNVYTGAERVVAGARSWAH